MGDFNVFRPRIGVLAVQGAFIEHERMLERLGAVPYEIRQARDLEIPSDGLILPGGESTVMGKLLRQLGLFEPLKAEIEAGLPVFGTCAGLILLAGCLSNDPEVYFGTLPVTVRRNAYGRQLGSFYTQGEMAHVGRVEMPFIRAPYIESVEPGAEVLAWVSGHIVGVRCRNQLAISFHPEVTDDTSVHRYFLEMVEQAAGRPAQPVEIASRKKKVHQKRDAVGTP